MSVTHHPTPVWDEGGNVVEVICAPCSDEVSEHWDNGDGSVVIGAGVRWSSCPQFQRWTADAVNALLDRWDLTPMAPGSNKAQMRDELRSILSGASFDAHCADCGALWRPVRRGECVRCGSDATPTPMTLWDALEPGPPHAACANCGEAMTTKTCPGCRWTFDRATGEWTAP